VETNYSDPIWEDALEVISRQVNEGTFNIWFAQTAGLGLTDSLYSVGVSSDFAKDWIDSRFRTIISDAVAQVVGSPVEIEIVVVPNLDNRLSQAGTEPGDRAFSTGGAGAGVGGPDTDGDGDGIRSTAQSAAGSSAGSGGSSLTPGIQRRAAPSPQAGPTAAAGLGGKYTFDTFVVGQSNRFAHAAALAAAETPGTQYNPLFIYGGVGLGKTHLLQAVGHYVLRNHPGLRVRYVTLETFTNEFINSLRDDSIEGFKNRYRTVDVLLIDDVQFLQKKEQTQEEFFHTFNALYDAQKQIVISSDAPPRAIPTLEERLHSRFEWGLIADIQPPDLETKIAILRKKAEAKGVILDDEVILFIAANIKSNVRELEGALVRLVAYSSLTGKAINLELAQRVLHNLLESQTRVITIGQIQRSVAEHYQLRISELKAKDNSRRVAEPRQIAMYLSKELTQNSLSEIGREFGGKHHTTVMHAIRKVDRQQKDDPKLKATLSRLVESIQ
jgi:chromosomal replication initiator protein